MACRFFHKWVIKRCFGDANSSLYISGYECQKCNRRKLSGLCEYVSTKNVQQAVNWLNKESEQE